MNLSSVKFAQVFDVPHRTVTRSIRRLKRNKVFYDLFVESTYQDRHFEYPCYWFGKDGYSLLASRYGGYSATKDKYFEEFIKANNIHNRKTQYQENNTLKILHKNQELQRRIDELENRTFFQRLFKG